jgi:D-alanyl-D-alanine carboxypeptidase/D-alanyl-D-alanine-endopeptidase (penicillin-binding protein 4)
MKLRFSILFLCLGGACAGASTWGSAASAQPRLHEATRERLQQLLLNPDVKNAHIGVAVQSLGKAPSPQAFPALGASPADDFLFAWAHEKRFIPASNTKSFTVASALKHLGASRRFSTRLLGRGRREGSVWRGDILLRGGGDPSLDQKGIDALAQAIKRAGIARVTGDIIGDGTAYGAESLGGRYPDGWTLDDVVWYYGPETAALAIERNQIDIDVLPAQPGQPARLVAPTDAGFTILNRVRTVSKSAASQITFERASSSGAVGDVLTVSGSIAVGEKRSEGVAVPDPPRRAALLLLRALRQRGVAVQGSAQGPSRSAKAFASGGTELARHESPPLSELAARCLKPSDNLYAEMLLRNTAWLSPQLTPKPGENLAARGHRMMFDWLRSSGVDVDDLQFTDGSGLSRYNLVSPRACVGLLRAAQSLPRAEGAAFWNALPIAGVDGTLRRRMANTPAQNNARAKTGTFSIVSTLCGYVSTRDGHRLAVAVLSNFGRGVAVRQLQNDIFQTLAAADLEE